MSDLNLVFFDVTPLPGFYDLITPAMSLSHVIQSLEDEEKGPLVVATGGRLGWDVKEKEKKSKGD